MLEMEFSHDKASEVEKDLISLYITLLNDILKEIFYFKGKYTEQEYQQPTRLEDLPGFVVGVRTNLEGLTYSIENSINNTLGVVLNAFTDHLSEIYKHIFDNEEKLNEALENKWCGSTYKDSLIECTRQYAYKLKKEVYASLIRGNSKKQIKDLVTKYITSFRKKVITILSTETTYVTNQALIDKGISIGYAKVMINEILDSRTCGFCSGKDGEIVPIKNIKIGSNVPPFHQNCRGTIEYIK